MFINPFKPYQGIFTLPNEFARSRGKRPLIFGPNQWSDLTVWIASETVNPSTFDLDTLMKRCAHENMEVRNMAIREWSRRIGRALVIKEAYKQFAVGEEHYNGPKICEKTRKTILMSDLTQIILDHWVKVQVWYYKHMQTKQQQLQKQKPQKQPRLPEPEPEPEPELEPELVIEDNGDLDNWEDLDD